jgi:hypothetical protein
MSTSRLLDLWAPPPGYRLASVTATTYQLQADFIEEDLLPVALSLRQSPARGREFRIELEKALQDVEITIYLHPDGYTAGLRRSPRVDLIPVPEARLRKLHAKVALLLFVPEQGDDAAARIVRLVTGSANLTNSGYRRNIELAVAVDDVPGAAAMVATTVRDAAEWFQQTLPPETEQAKSQHRALQAVFKARPISPERTEMEFVGLPRKGGLLQALSDMDLGKVHTMTAASPFWPTGDDADDIASGVLQACRGVPALVRLIGPCRAVDERLYAEMPPALLKSLIGRGVGQVEVAYAIPGFGCAPERAVPEVDRGEYDGMGAVTTAALPAWRPLHAKALLIEGSKASVLAMGSFNFTRRGLGLHGRASNTEAGMLWRVPAKSSDSLRQALGFSGPWRKVNGALDDLVIAPGPMDGECGQQWPAFIRSIRASRSALIFEGDGPGWPASLKVSMRDIRSRLAQVERNFDAWVIARPEVGENVRIELPLVASWMEAEGQQALSRYPALPDLEVLLEWGDQRTVLPVVFIDKHEFPVVERTIREDERMLLDWFLGLRPTDEADADGYGHGFDPETGDPASEAGESAGILSYLVRDFVHALPGIRAHLEEGASTETGLRMALLGPRSPAKLAEECLDAWMKPSPERPRKSDVATTFQLLELRKLVEHVSLPGLPDGMTEQLRSQCLARIDGVVATIVKQLKQPLDPVLGTYVRSKGRGSHAAA